MFSYSPAWLRHGEPTDRRAVRGMPYGWCGNCSALSSLSCAAFSLAPCSSYFKIQPWTSGHIHCTMVCSICTLALFCGACLISSNSSLPGSSLHPYHAYWSQRQSWQGAEELSAPSSSLSKGRNFQTLWHVGKLVRGCAPPAPHPLTHQDGKTWLCFYLEPSAPVT